jgi:hypothetical protein
MPEADIGGSEQSSFSLFVIFRCKSVMTTIIQPTPFGAHQYDKRSLRQRTTDERALRRCSKPISRFRVDDRRQQLPGNGTSN